MFHSSHVTGSVLELFLYSLELTSEDIYTGYTKHSIQLCIINYDGDTHMQLHIIMIADTHTLHMQLHI